jgi:hypothetical protein
MGWASNATPGGSVAPWCLRPGCAVKEAVEHDEIAPERYLSYLNIL